MKILFNLGFLLVAVLGGSFALAQNAEPYEQSPINYSATEPKDAAAELQARINSGKLVLGEVDGGIVQNLLRELRIPVESQLLIFSENGSRKTCRNTNQ